MKTIFITAILLFCVAFNGCNSSQDKDIPPVSPDKTKEFQDINTVKSGQSADGLSLETIGMDIYHLTEEELWSLYEKSGVIEYVAPVNLTPEPHERTLPVFVYSGIEAFYQLNKRVPDNYQEYMDSGIPMIIPRDEQSGNLYHPVNDLDFNDSSGFTFSSDGNETCRFTFVINGEAKEYLINSGYWRPYKNIDGIKGPLAGDYEFDRVKREYILKFLTNYTALYAESHQGQAPDTIGDVFDGRGQLIKKGWQWTPEPGEVTEYIEFGFDTERDRYYHIMGSNKRTPDAKMPVWVYQLYGPDKMWDKKINDDFDIPGIVHWEFNTENVRSDVIDMKPYFTSDQCYEIYEQITQL